MLHSLPEERLFLFKMIRGGLLVRENGRNPNENASHDNNGAADNK
jgi:hypothetical protein